MPSPFPGMDPYLEGPLWPDVHQGLASAIRTQLTPRRRPRYVARLATRVVRESDPESEVGIMYPDVEVLQNRSNDDLAERATDAGASPALLTVPAYPPVYEKLVTVEIRDAETNRLVSAIEVISPVNKHGKGFEEYRRKRDRLRRSRTHLLEIDLLRRGERVVPGRRVPASNYPIALTRAGAQVTELWPLDLRDRLLKVPVPLREQDPDIPLDVGAALAATYESAAYDLSIDYSQPPPPPELSPEDADWVRQLTSKLKT